MFALSSLGGGKRRVESEKGAMEEKSLRNTALDNLPWRASVSCHQVQCNIPTFEALRRYCENMCSLPVS